MRFQGFQDPFAACALTWHEFGFFFVFCISQRIQNGTQFIPSVLFILKGSVWGVWGCSTCRSVSSGAPSARLFSGKVKVGEGGFSTLCTPDQLGLA